MNTNTNNIYRDVTMDNISEKNVGETVRIAGWIENIRDHGGVAFIDLRDMYGVMQVVMRDTSLLEGLNKEDCISVEGPIEHRDEETYNPKIPTGTIELEAHKIDILGKVYRDLPFEIATSKEIREDVRLKYRYLDLRNRKVKDNILFRSKVIRFLREKMEDMGFVEVQTPILCASSPEGARDYVVPSRKYKGKFYALPQAPQQYKQLLMVSGIDKYYQIAPCFRDEDARADRSPGEFYQLDFEMAFATQEDVFKIGEEVLTETFKKFAPEGSVITEAPYPIFSYKEAMLQYVQKSGGEIISKKGATFYAVSSSVCKLCSLLVSSSESISTVSTMMHGEYGIDDVCLSTLTLVGPNGVQGKVPMRMTKAEIEQLKKSADALKEIIAQIDLN